MKLVITVYLLLEWVVLVILGMYDGVCVATAGTWADIKYIWKA